MLCYGLDGFDFIGVGLLRGLEDRDYFCVGVFSFDVANEGFVVFAQTGVVVIFSTADDH